MSNHTTHSHRFPFFQRWWKPAALSGAGGTAIVIWFEELIAFGTELLALIFLPILAGVIYLLDLFIFKSRMPRREDLDTPIDKGAQK